jgi:hypothetical protein
LTSFHAPPANSGALADLWAVYRRRLRKVDSSDGALRIRRLMLEPLKEPLGYADFIDTERVRTREGDEDSGLLMANPDGGRLRIWTANFDEDLDAAAFVAPPGKDEEVNSEWMLDETGRFDGVFDSENSNRTTTTTTPTSASDGAAELGASTIKGPPVHHGSFDPESLTFSANPDHCQLEVMLSPARSRCVCCGGTAGSHAVLTPVALGTSAAVKVAAGGLVEALAEVHAGDTEQKQRLLIFSDSPQDAAHQARFIAFASRYDRMRRRLIELIERQSTLTVQRAVELCEGRGAEQDNPKAPPRGDRIYPETRDALRAWEQATLLDEIAVAAGYCNTVVNLGLVTIEYNDLCKQVVAAGKELRERLTICEEQFVHLCRCVLDEMRIRSAVSRKRLVTTRCTPPGRPTPGRPSGSAGSRRRWKGGA